MNIGSAIVKYTGAVFGSSSGRGVAPTLSQYTKAFDNASEMQGLIKAYFGVDIQDLPNWTPEQLGQFVDLCKKTQIFIDNLPKVEEFLKDYMKNIATWNQVVARCVKAGAKEMEKIDQATADVILSLYGYKAHHQKIAKDIDVEKRKIDQEVTNYFDLSEYDLNAALALMATKLSKQKEAIDKRPVEAADREAFNQEQNWEKTYLKNIINYGYEGTQRLMGGSTAPQYTTVSNNGTGSANGNGFFGWLKDFFSGK
jgi:hypothetical protein